MKMEEINMLIFEINILTFVVIISLGYAGLFFLFQKKEYVDYAKLTAGAEVFVKSTSDGKEFIINNPTPSSHCQNYNGKRIITISSGATTILGKEGLSLELSSENIRQVVHFIKSQQGDSK